MQVSTSLRAQENEIQSIIDKVDIFMPQEQTPQEQTPQEQTPGSNDQTVISASAEDVFLSLARWEDNLTSTDVFLSKMNNRCQCKNDCACLHEEYGKIKDVRYTECSNCKTIVEFKTPINLNNRAGWCIYNLVPVIGEPWQDEKVLGKTLYEKGEERVVVIYSNEKVIKVPLINYNLRKGGNRTTVVSFTMDVLRYE